MSFISFSEVDRRLADRQPLYIKNVTRHRSSGTSSILVINYPSAEGDRSFNIPRTTIPFNICDYVDQESLRASASFRKAVNNGALEILEEDTAELELRDPAKRQALQAAIYEADNTTIYQARSAEAQAYKDADAQIRAEKQREQSAGMKHMLAGMDPALAKALNLTRSDGQFQDPKPVLTANPRFSALEARVKANSLTADQVVNELSLMYGDLTTTDLQSIATTSFWPQAAQTWARERIAYQLEADSAKN